MKSRSFSSSYNSGSVLGKLDTSNVIKPQSSDEDESESLDLSVNKELEDKLLMIK